MERTTLAQLEGTARIINRLTGSPEAPYTKGADGRFTANIGCYHIGGAYGGVSLHRMLTDGGGVSDVFRCGHIPKRDLWERMRAFIDGLETERERTLAMAEACQAVADLADGQGRANLCEVAGQARQALSA